MKRLRDKGTFHIYIIFFILLIGILAACFILVLYNITIQKPDGELAISKWPIDFTESFSGYITFTNDQPHITQPGLDLLQENSLWIQIIDADGDEALSARKPQQIPAHYSPTQLLDVYQFGEAGCSVFFGSIKSDKQEWAYIIGFPVQISKITYYVNKERFATLKPVFLIIVGVVLIILIISGSVYGFQTAKKMARMRKSIREIATRTYKPEQTDGSYGDIYKELNTLNAEIKCSDEQRARNEKMREEWIANITHDLKTPLSPIKGYAEMIEGSDALPYEQIKKYGGIISKNIAYAEELVNDLKLTYQLENEMLKLHKAKQNVARFVKEIVIDFLNNPEYKSRNILFHSPSEQIQLPFDATLLKRALINLITNALVHNSSETIVSVSVKTGEKIQILVEDNGCGMTEEELRNLFLRYYCGHTMESKPEGSGLGMAIAKQIIELHGGSIIADSKAGAGTSITVEFPKVKD